jgi:hypothetical protein
MDQTRRSPSPSDVALKNQHRWQDVQQTTTTNQENFRQLPKTTSRKRIYDNMRNFMSVDNADAHRNASSQSSQEQTDTIIPEQNPSLRGRTPKLARTEVKDPESPSPSESIEHRVRPPRKPDTTANAITKEARNIDRRNRARQVRRDNGEQNVSDNETLDDQQQKKLASVRKASEELKEALEIDRRNRARQVRRNNGKQDVSDNETLDDQQQKKIASVRKSSEELKEARNIDRKNRARQVRRNNGEQNVSDNETLDDQQQKKLASARKPRKPSAK